MKNKVPEKLLPLLISNLPISALLISKEHKNPNVDPKAPKILVKRDTTAHSWGLISGFWISAGPNKEYIDLFLIRSTSGYLALNSVSSNSVGLYGDIYDTAPSRSSEFKIPDDGVHLYTDFTGSTEKVTMESLIKDHKQDLATHPSLVYYSRDKYVPTICQHLSIELSELEYDPNETVEAKIRRIRNICIRPYKHIGFRVFKNHKVFKIYGSGIPNPDGSIDDNIYMKLLSKKASNKSATIVEAINVYDREKLKYIESVNKMPLYALHYDTRYQDCNYSKKYDFVLSHVSTPKAVSTLQLAPETVEAIVSVFGEAESRYVVSRHVLPKELRLITPDIYPVCELGKKLDIVGITHPHASDELQGVLSTSFTKKFYDIDKGYCVHKVDFNKSAKDKIAKNLEFSDMPERVLNAFNNLLSKCKSESKVKGNSKGDSKGDSKTTTNTRSNLKNSKAAIDRENEKNVNELMASGKLGLSLDEIDKLRKCLATTYYADIDNSKLLNMSYRHSISMYEGEVCITDVVEHNGEYYNIFKELRVCSSEPIDNLLSSILPHPGITYRKMYTGPDAGDAKELERSDHILSQISYGSPTDNIRDSFIQGHAFDQIEMLIQDGCHYVVNTHINLSNIIVIPARTGTYIQYESPDIVGASLAHGVHFYKSEGGFLHQMALIGKMSTGKFLKFKKASTHCGYTPKGVERCIIDTGNVFSNENTGLYGVLPEYTKYCSPFTDYGCIDIYISANKNTYSCNHQHALLFNHVLFKKRTDYPKYIKTAFEQGDACGIDRRLIYVLGTSVSWLNKPGGRCNDTLKNTYYRSLSDIFLGLPHNKILTLYDKIKPSIDRYGLLACSIIQRLFVNLKEYDGDKISFVISFGGNCYGNRGREVRVNMCSLSDEQFCAFFEAINKMVYSYCKLATEYYVNSFERPQAYTDTYGIARLVDNALDVINVLNPNGTVKTSMSKAVELCSVMSAIIDSIGVECMRASRLPELDTLKDTLRGIYTNKMRGGDAAEWSLEELYRIANVGTDVVNQINRLETRMITQNETLHDNERAELLKKANNDYKTKVYPKISKLAYENEKYAIVVPSELEEIKIEGSRLHHCVGSYTTAVSRGETTIVFLRQKEDVNTPFMTCEVYQGSIRQIHGLMNNNIKDQKDSVGINGFIEAWCDANKISFSHNNDRLLAPPHQ